MSPAQWLVAVVTALYLGAAVAYVWQGKYAWAMAYACYALANVGLILADRQ